MEQKIINTRVNRKDAEDGFHACVIFFQNKFYYLKCRSHYGKVVYTGMTGSEWKLLAVKIARVDGLELNDKENWLSKMTDVLLRLLYRKKPMRNWMIVINDCRPPLISPHFLKPCLISIKKILQFLFLLLPPPPPLLPSSSCPIYTK